MKIKKKQGPHEFLFRMGLRVKAPRVHKLFVKRENLRSVLRWQPNRKEEIAKKVHRIDLELERRTEDLKTNGFAEGRSSPIDSPSEITKPLPFPWGCLRSNEPGIKKT